MQRAFSAIGGPGRSRQRQSGAARPIAMLSLLTVLVISWLLWSGIYKPLLLVLGFLSCLLCVYLAKRMGFFERLLLIRVVVAGLPGYWTWLFKEIVISSIEVARIVLDRRLPISPTVVEIDAGTDSDAVQVILGNSITLSPGTVTLDVYEGKLRVHCLTRAGAQALERGEAQRRALALEQQ